MNSRIGENQMENIVQKKIKEVFILLESIEAMTTKFNFRNEQWFLDYQDKLNEISIRK